MKLTDVQAYERGPTKVLISIAYRRRPGAISLRSLMARKWTNNMFCHALG